MRKVLRAKLREDRELFRPHKPPEKVMRRLRKKYPHMEFELRKEDSDALIRYFFFTDKEKRYRVGDEWITLVRYNEKPGENDVIEIPNGVDILGDCSFCDIKARSVILPKSLVKVDDNAFENCRIEELDTTGIPADLKKGFSRSNVGRLTLHAGHLLSFISQDPGELEKEFSYADTIITEGCEIPWRDNADRKYSVIKALLEIVNHIKNRKDEKSKAILDDNSIWFRFLRMAFPEQALELLDRLYKTERREEFDEILSLIGNFSVDVFERITDCAAEKNTGELYVVLTKYRHEHFGSDDENIAERFEL